MTEVNQEMLEVTLSVGDTVEGTVLDVQDKFATVDIGYKSDAILPIKEASNFHVEKVEEVVSKGDVLSFKVKKLEDDDVVLSRREVLSENAWGTLNDRYESQEVFEVVVKELTKGGVLADVGVRGFIPISQLSTSYIEDCTPFVGSTIEVVVMDIDPSKNRVVLSHRQVLQQRKDAAKRTAISTYEVGQTYKGKVARITDFGAFVTLGDIDGLVHVSEISFEHIKHPQEKLQVGEEVEVKVLAVDVEKQKLSLSIKATQAHPWLSLTEG
ncbi:MAG: 30S ribosomal protein S1, partial [Bacilli bacterium]